jgi:5-dehydro-2-deoxygluconokinase
MPRPVAGFEPVLDVVAIGRSSVDLYGQQVGGRLEDMASFSKAVGGCPTNIAIGAARLGLKSGLITRVGDEHMGRFIVEQCRREGVNVDGIATDPQRLTSLVILGIRDDRTFPLIFYRDNCADSALCEADIAESYVAAARSIVVTGTHFARPGTAAAQNRAIALARKHGRKVIFDIDYRPNLWGLAGHGAGEARYIKSDDVTAHLHPILPLCDLIVGTEEELMIAGGGDDVVAALRAIRARSQATIVCKRGPMGCSVFDAAIPATLEEGIQGPGFPVEVYNVLGAGDAFMAGFLRGYLRGEPMAMCCTYANACGAFAVSRLLCSVEYPTEPELQHFLAHGSDQRALRHDRNLNHIHWTTTRARLHDLAEGQGDGGPLMALAIDHRAQFETMADLAGEPRARIAPFKALALTAAREVRQAYPELPDGAFGLFLDGTYGREALFRASDSGLWIARPVEEPGSRPLDFEGSGSLAAKLVEWPVIHTIKCLAFYHPDDPAELRARQDRELQRVYDAARALGRELLIELIAGKNGSLDEMTLARLIEHLYRCGIRPDWWKLEPQQSEAAWANIAAVIAAHDPACRGILMLGLDAPIADLVEALARAAPCPALRGFAIGRTIFARPAEAWLRNTIDDAEAVKQMTATFRQLVEVWLAAKRLQREN